MLPTVAIIGRPNVGKSTLYNVLTRSRDALVVDTPGVTRDRQFGLGRLGEKPYLLIDTGGIGESDSEIDQLTAAQVDAAVAEADQILFVVDYVAGLTATDEALARQLRPYRDRLIVVVNKSDRVEADVAAAEFYAMGLGEPTVIAANQKRGVASLVDRFQAQLPEPEVDALNDPYYQGISVAVVGRPNAGKSTLINRMLGEERVVVMDEPGTTRDSIKIPFERRGEHYVLIDTAGVRRKSKVHDTVEKYSVLKTLQAVQEARVVLFLVDAKANLSDQDLKLLDFIVEDGKALIILFNKCDGLTDEQKDDLQRKIDLKLAFVSFAEQRYISALQGTGVGDLYRCIQACYRAAMKEVTTSEVTEALEAAVRQHQPPLVNGRRIKLRYAHMGGYFPFTVVIHGKQVQKLPGSYKRYLSNFLTERFSLTGVPIRLVFQQDTNPYTQ